MNQLVRRLIGLPERIGPQLAGAEAPSFLDRVVWFIVGFFVLIVLGATIVIAAEVWCFIHASNGMYAVFAINPWQFQVGCW
jgi:uncharacterized membrane protein